MEGLFMLTPMEKIERRCEFLAAHGAVDTRIKEIGRVFSLMAAVDQYGFQIKLESLTQCMAALGVENAGGKTVQEILLSSGADLRNKTKIVHPHLRREHARLRQNRRIAQRHARALRKVAQRYIFRPGVPE